MLGLKRGTVTLCEHEREWECEAENTMHRLKQILGDAIKDIQHVGSTAIPSIKAKPIIDIALAADDFGEILGFEKELKGAGFSIAPMHKHRSGINCCLPAAAFIRARGICKRISFMLFVQTVWSGSIT